MSPATKALPSYLRAYIGEQNYASYTAQDHAAWRYIMRQNRAFFGRHAVPIYVDGLKRTGISLERIPRVEEMDECLAQFGWGAVPVQGFIPPAAFLDFQARSVLPIACDMRTVSHLAYTPAPDIVHEAAGHAPIIADLQYAKYLSRYAGMAQRAVFSEDDIRLYEAIRYLSDLKENPDATSAQIQAAEERLKTVTRSLGEASEASRVARMNWWTVEYGLVGNLKNPLIYGAGLLSSVGESQTCLSDGVRKIPLTTDCVEMPYDITEPQPQLYVARDMDQLSEVLIDFEKTLSYIRGGVDGLATALQAKTVTTTELESGLQISGVLSDFQQQSTAPTFIRFMGPVQIAYASTQLAGHGSDRHPTGFSTPLGKWKKSALKTGASSSIEFDSGFKVSGTLLRELRQDGKLLLLTWGDCRVTLGKDVFFEPAWGEFDMAVGEKVVSVSGGPADRAAYGEFNVGKASTTPGRKSPFSLNELKLFEAYAELRRIRESKGGTNLAALESLASKVLEKHPNEWLILLELLEMSHGTTSAWEPSVAKALERIARHSEEPQKELISKGLELLNP